MKIVKRFHLGKLATFAPNKKLPIYNWFYFKEAFSRDLVFLLAETWGLGEGDLLLDPFCGTGTAPLACKQLGIDSIGYDVHPIMLFASRVKLGDYNVEELKPIVRKLVRSKFERPKVEVPAFITKTFSKSVLEDVIFFKQRISEVGDKTTREFLLLGLMNAAMRCSWTFKDGAAIKVHKRRVPSLRSELRKQLTRMCHDVESFKTKTCRITIKHGDARRIELRDERVDAVVTSPPYLGKQEYTHVYKIEEYLLGQESKPTDFIGGRTGDVSSEDFSEIEGLGEFSLTAKPYFKDMATSTAELYRVCRSGAKVAMVVSDGCFPKGVIEVGGTLSKIAEKIGFSTKQMVIINRRTCTTPSRKKIGVANESLLIWEK